MLTEQLNQLRDSGTLNFSEMLRAIRRKEWIYFWQLRYTVYWFPLVLGIVMSFSLAQTIVTGDWHLSLGIIAAIPVTILFLQYPISSLIIWFALAPFIQVTPDAAFRAVFWAVHRAMFPAALMIVLMANQLRIKKEATIKLSRLDFAMVGSLAIIFIHIFYFFPNNPLPQIYFAYDRFFVPFCAFWIIRFLSPKEEQLKIFAPIACAIIGFNTVIALLSWLAPQFLPDMYVNRLTGFRAQGTFFTYGGFTIGMMWYGLFAFYAGVRAQTKFSQFTYFIFFGLSQLDIFLSFSRGSWLSALIVVMGLFFLYPKIMARLTIIMMGLMSVLAVTVLAAQFEFADERLNDDENVNTRYVIYAASYEMIKARPLFGWGYGQYDEHDRQFYRRVANFSLGNKDFTSHNTWFTVLAERGIVGFGFHFFPFFWLLYLTIKVWNRIPADEFMGRNLLAIFWFNLIFRVVSGSFSDTDSDNFIFTVWWMSQAFIANITEEYLEPSDTGLPAWMYRSKSQLASGNPLLAENTN